jgi:hypothetical protein
MADFLYYVYAVVPATAVVRSAPAGVDGLPVELTTEGKVAALVSRVGAAVYGADLDDRIADVSVARAACDGARHCDDLGE